MRTGLSRACATGMAVAASFMGLSVLLPAAASAAPATVRSSALAGPAPAGAGTDSPPVSGPKVAGRAGFALKGSPAARNATPAQVPAPNPGSDMTNHGGNIMLSPVIYNVFWLPAGHYESPGSAASDANYENLLNRWAGDVGGNDFYNIVTQYTGANGRPSNSVSLGGSYTDTTAYPHAGTQADPLSDGDIHGAVDRAVTHFSSPRDLNHIYMVYTGLGIEECFSATSCTFEHNPGDGAFCAYHTVFGGPSLYAFMGAAGVSRGCGGATTPNGDAFADNEASVASHELIESVTDPQLDAWFFNDTSGEIGDLCNQQFGPRDSIGANLFLGATPNPYALQMEWSNAVHSCAPDLNSARTSIVPPVLTLVKSAPATAVTGQQINYSMTVTNPSNTDASTLTVVTDTLPSGVTFVAGSASPAPSSISPLTWNLGTLGVHDTKSITLQATSNPQSVNNCGAVNFKDELQIAAQAQVTGCAATVIAKANTTIAVMSSANPSVFGQPVTFTATVTANPPGAGTPTGTVQFFDGATSIGAGTLSGATTTIAAPASVISSVGTHHITATYSGDGSFLGSTSTVFDQVVNKAPTTIGLTAAPPGSVGFGHPVTFTATVSVPPPGAGSPTGPVVFTVDGTPVGTVNLNASEQASITTASLSPGSHVIGAAYQGDGNFLGSSTTLTYLVTCTVTITGNHPGGVIASGDSTCIVNATVGGSVVVPKGTSLAVENSTINGSISASNSPNAIRICAATVVGGAVNVIGAQGLVIVGDPGDANCAVNNISGALQLRNNLHGVEAIGNTVGSLIVSNNSGPGPFPGDGTTISGNIIRHS